MTSGDWFVDIRMNKAEGSIDWAFAGERKTLRTDDDGLSVCIISSLFLEIDKDSNVPMDTSH